MVDKQNTFVVREALLEELFAFYTFGYSPDEEGFSQFRQDFDKYITCRFGSIFADAKYVVIEQSYVETEWKDMISLHYINTTYAAKLLPRTIRIHFFTAPKLADDECLGFITLRPIEEIQIALSYIFVNLDMLKKTFEADEGEHIKCKFVGYAKRIHCLGGELSIKTYPLLTQDTIVTCCADVNIVTLSRFLAHKLGGKKLEIRDICKDDYNVVFPRQITADRFIKLCSKMHIPFKTRHIYANALDNTIAESDKVDHSSTSPFRSQKEITRYIDTYLDSDLPVVIFVRGHVIQIIGYKCVNGSKEYLVLDDSGFMDPESKNRCCYFSDIKTALSPIPSYTNADIPCMTTSGGEGLDEDIKLMFRFHHFLQNSVITIGIPQSDRVYIDYYYYEILLENMIRYQWSTGSEPFNLFLDEERNFLPGVEIRSQLVECTYFMQYLLENIRIAEAHADLVGIDRVIANLEGAVSTLQSLPLPHYLWYTELTNDCGVCVGLCADPTRFYKDTTHLHKVFYNSLFDDDKRGIAVVKSMWDFD